jgi:serine/threonine protein kinase
MFVAAHYIRVSLDKGPMADEGSRDIVSRLTSALAGRYRVEREIGSGGMATVYLATDLRHSRVVAIKVLNREIAQAVGGDRFIREISITARLQASGHPHVDRFRRSRRIPLLRDAVRRRRISQVEDCARRCAPSLRSVAPVS